MILNLTQHFASKEQIEEGVFEPEDKEKVKKLLTFNELPSKEEIKERARLLTGIAIVEGAEKAMIGGAPYLMSSLEKKLKEFDIQPVYAFSKRIVEETEKDGEIIKKSIFKHIGFIEV